MPPTINQPFQPTPIAPAAQPQATPQTASPQNLALLGALGTPGVPSQSMPTTTAPVTPPAQALSQPSAQPPAQAPTQSPTPQQMSVDDFANSIKQKYPQYQSLDNQTLAQKIIAKYPQYASQVNMQTPGTSGPPGYFSRLGSSLVNGSVGQETIGLGKGVLGTLSGISSMGQNALSGITNLASHAFGGGNISTTPTANQTFGAALAPQGLGQQVGNAEEKLGELVSPTGDISAAKDVIGATDLGDLASKIPGIGGALENGINTAKDAIQSIPYAGKAVSYVAQKTLNAIPEAAFGTTYGLTQGENPGQAVKQGGVFGALSGLGEVAGDTFNAIKGGVVDNINKALGATGKMSVQQALDRVPKALNAFETMANMADDITVKTPEGVEKTWEPAKDGFYEALQGLQQTKQNVFDAYTELAKNAGSQGAVMTGEDLGKVMNQIGAEGEDATSAFKSKAGSLINDLKDNFGSYDNQGNFTGFKDVELPRIQNFIQKINTDVNPLSDKAGAAVSDTASKALRNIMDSKIEDASFLNDIQNKQLPSVGGAETDPGKYQALRNTYSDLKSVENDMVNQLKKSYRGVGGRVGQYVEGFGSLDTILGALSHNPVEAARGVGMAGIGKLMNYLRDPEVGLQNAFEQIQDRGVGPLQNRILGGGEAEGTTASPVAPKTPPTNPIADQATGLTKANGGVTINMKGEMPTDGYAVGTGKQYEQIVPENQYSPATTAKYMTDHAGVLNQPGNHLGMWVDNGKVYYDVSTVHPDPVQASKAAKNIGEEGIYDLKNGTTIGKADYEKIISDAEAQPRGNARSVRPTGSQDTSGQEATGRTGKVKTSKSPVIGSGVGIGLKVKPTL